MLESLAAGDWPRVECVLVSPTPSQAYSGMVPGYLRAHYDEADTMAAFKVIPRAPELLPRPTFETDPTVLTVKTNSAKDSVSTPWAERFPGVTQRLINALASN